MQANTISDLTELPSLIASANAASIMQTAKALMNDHQPEAALRLFEALAALTPRDLNVWYPIIGLRFTLKLPHAALDACNKALEIDPERADTLFNTGLVLSVLGKPDAALHCYERVLAKQRDHYSALRNRALLLAQLGRAKEAKTAAVDALNYSSRDAALYFNRGELLIGMHSAAEAVVAYRTALSLDENLHAARYGLAVALAALGKIKEAHATQALALQLAPELVNQYRSPFVLDTLNGANELQPERIAVLYGIEAFRQCDWSAYENFNKLFIAIVEGAEDTPPYASAEMPHLAMLLPLEPSVTLQTAATFASRLKAACRPELLIRLPRKKDGKLRLGYISANFDTHPLSFLLSRMFARHDRSRFDVLAYSVGPTNRSTERRQVEQGVDVFRDVAHLPSQSIAQLIVNDHIDILVDLSGYTLRARPEVLAYRPAAIQVSYTYMATHGADHIDYALLDRYEMTEAHRPYWREHIAYLPDTSFYCEYPAIDDDVIPEDARLQNVFVLGALHMPAKLEPVALGIWFSLLQAVPQSVLWLLSEMPEQEENLRAMAIGHGVDPDRLIFSPLVPHQQHLQRLPLIDIFLDLFVCNGHTTTVEVLSAGVPVVTVPGESVAARVAGSMLHTHGLPELVCENIADYKAAVVRFAADLVWRAHIEGKAKDKANSRLFSPDTRIREIESAYQMMWARHSAGLAPADFDVPSQR